jgi:hypothetical protein
VGEVMWVLLGFVALVCVLVYFRYSVGCLCQELQGVGFWKVYIVDWSAVCECRREG